MEWNNYLWYEYHQYTGRYPFRLFILDVRREFGALEAQFERIHVDYIDVELVPKYDDVPLRLEVRPREARALVFGGHRTVDRWWLFSCHPLSTQEFHQAVTSSRQSPYGSVGLCDRSTSLRRCSSLYASRNALRALSLLPSEKPICARMSLHKKPSRVNYHMPIMYLQTYGSSGE